MWAKSPECNRDMTDMYVHAETAPEYQQPPRDSGVTNPTHPHFIQREYGLSTRAHTTPRRPCF